MDPVFTNNYAPLINREHAVVNPTQPGEPKRIVYFPQEMSPKFALELAIRVTVLMLLISFLAFLVCASAWHLQMIKMNYNKKYYGTC